MVGSIECSVSEYRLRIWSFISDLDSGELKEFSKDTGKFRRLRISARRSEVHFLSRDGGVDEVAFVRTHQAELYARRGVRFDQVPHVRVRHVKHKQFGRASMTCESSPEYII